VEFEIVAGGKTGKEEGDFNRERRSRDREQWRPSQTGGTMRGRARLVRAISRPGFCACPQLWSVRFNADLTFSQRLRNNEELLYSQRGGSDYGELRSLA
jgi:hypothetical protein